MGIYDDITKDVSAAFDTDLADAVVPFVYRERITGDLDPTTGIYASTYEDEDSRGVVLELSADNIKQFGADSTSFKLLLLNEELFKVPKTDNKVVINGQESVIYGITQDPAYTTWSLICKKAS